jgi:tetraacyldisaccharide 4'-kinase
MRAPEFWRERSMLSTALLPAAALYERIDRLKRSWTTPRRAAVPVICAGNLVAGGAGKTPLALALAARLAELGVAVQFITRGYGGRLAGPVAVDPARHDFRAVGDEALLLAAAAPTWVARDRVAGAARAVAAGAGAVVLDDGLQNPNLVYDLALIAVDGGYGFGNGLSIPAGPVRGSLEAGLARAGGDSVRVAVLIGEDRAGAMEILDGRMQVARASLVPAVADGAWAGRRVLAFAGIGRPSKFFETLEELGAVLVGHFAFPDHHPYADGELVTLLTRANAAGALPVTTAKDWVRIPPDFRPHIDPLPIRLAWNTAEDAALIDRLLAEAMARS